MSTSGISLQVAGDGDRFALHEAIWESARAFIGRYLAAPEYENARQYPRHAVEYAKEEGFWGVYGDELYWEFMAGPGAHVAHAWAHWLRLAFAVEWESLEELARRHRLTITSEPLMPSELLRGDGRHWLTARGTLWSADEKGLHQFVKHVAATELTADERAQHAEALRLCRCAPCSTLRPDEGVLTPLLGALESEDTAASAAWYLTRTQTASPEVLEALVRAGRFAMRELAPDLGPYARRLPDAWPMLTALLPDLRGGARALALHALAHTTRDDADRALLVRELCSALLGSDAAAQASAELLGWVSEGAPEVTEELAAVLDRDVAEELRHNVVLALVNLHLPAARPSRSIRTRLAGEARRDTEAGRLAQWMLAVLPTT
ncbi:acyl-CoA dehydrogenase family protein [Streptomyces kaniharaensis]|uniref:Acyl-CoA dehydrogenase family protein n=1 Tax=Streptomyces kaniharaensis TaxID=212423 RepID=A0A6N7KY16_9ACTN|nr:hypothetical protein [Streptomyces kaniharaensis]MQS16430.1 acyl-CoA dehydrogenase family protein [Streptomyces kaniharaensis]